MEHDFVWVVEQNGILSNVAKFKAALVAGTLDRTDSIKYAQKAKYSVVNRIRDYFDQTLLILGCK